MDHFAGLDVSVKETSVCIVDDTGKIVREVKVASEPEALLALLHRLIVLAGARTRIGRLGVPIALEKEAEAVVAPVVAARNGDIDRRPAHQEAALGLVVEHRDELGAIVGLAAQRLVRDDDRGSTVLDGMIARSRM